MPNRSHCSLSVKLGAVGLIQIITSDRGKSKTCATALEIRAALERPARELRNARWQQATGTSGTIISIGEALRLKASSEAGQKTKGAQPAGDEVVLGKLARFNSRMAESTITERRAVPGISAQRSEIIVAGGQILEGTMRALRINALRTCSWALREGVLIDRLRRSTIPSTRGILRHRCGAFMRSPAVFGREATPKGRPPR